jgi:hypothetical protein
MWKCIIRACRLVVIEKDVYINIVKWSITMIALVQIMDFSFLLEKNSNTGNDKKETLTALISIMGKKE